MGFKKGENPHHPPKGASTKVEPIRELKAIQRIKRIIAAEPRNLCLFTAGINTAYRAGELLSITVGQVCYLTVGDLLDLKQSKTKTYRGATLNQTTIDAIHDWLKTHPDTRPDAPLFRSQKKTQSLDSSNRQPSGQKMVP